MSVIYKDECCGCATESYPCLGSSCKNRNVPHFYCDECGDECEPEELYVYSEYDKLLCKYCLVDKFKTVEEEKEKILEEYGYAD